MLSIMSSPTQRVFVRSDVDAAVASCFPGHTVQQATVLTGGSFGTVWRVGLDDGRDVVLKVGPDPAARVLRYEAGMLESEAEYLRLVVAAPEVPAARLLAQTPDYLFMSLVPGTPLPDLPAGTDTRGVRFASGAAIARLHRINGDFFGYAGPRARASTWPEAYRAMIEALLADAVDWSLALPVRPDEVRRAVEASTDVLATVTEPTLTHFDLWDGNVLAIADDGPLRLGGLVDGERHLFGDPFIDFVSPALFRDIFDDGRPVRGRLPIRPPVRGGSPGTSAHLVSQLYLYLVMLVEMPSRGLDRYGELHAGGRCSPSSLPICWQGSIRRLATKPRARAGPLDRQ